MLRVTASLIVMLLAGQPTGWLVCELWCGGSGAAGHHRAAGCHEPATIATASEQVLTARGCHDSDTSAALFVAEVKKAERIPAAQLLTVERTLVAPDPGRLSAPLPVFSVAVPRGPTQHTILRI